MNQKSFSVNLTTDEWKRVKELLECHTEEVYASVDIKQSKESIRNYIKDLHKDKVGDGFLKSVNILKNIYDKISTKSNSRDTEISELKKEIKSLQKRKSQKNKIIQLTKTNKLLKEQIDQQHKELQEIKDKLKSIIT